MLIILFLIVTNVATLILFHYKSIKCKQLESMLLRMKMTPHFLFNRLTNIHVNLYNINKELSTIIIDTANYIRYYVEHIDKLLVPLSQELAHWEESIHLYTKQLAKNVEFKYTFPNDFNPELMIVPALLDDIINNCFKRVKKHNGYIHLNITVEDQKLLFVCENNFDIYKNHSLQSGLKSLQKMLQLHYRHKHRLNIIEKNEYYQIQIMLRLS